jgi:predicted amidohydrolase YtcJ
MKASDVLLPLALLGSASYAASAPAADLIIVHANVHTLAKAHPAAEAIAIVGARIVAVGTAADINAWKGPQTSVIDAAGRLVLPGFNDAHVHFISAGANLDRVQLGQADSTEEFVRLIAEQAKKTPKGEWILGGNWDETKWTPSTLPTKALIDPVTRDNPVYLARYDGHAGLANSLAIRLAGLSPSTKDPDGGVIVRDEDGDPTGVFKDAAEGLITKAIPSMTRAQRMRAARRALAYAASLGVTSAQDMVPDLEDIAVYSVLLEQGKLTTRLYEAPSELGAQNQAALGLRRAWGSAFLRLGAVKGFADGSIGSRTAYLFEPFSDEPSNYGLLSDEMHPPEDMLARLKKADAAGLQLCIHAIGDRAISMVLDMFGAIEGAHGYHDQRFRIEHAQHIAPKDLDRFASLHVIASMQPYHAIDDGRFVEARIGPERAKTSYAWRAILDHGGRLAFGTDWDVAPLNPMLGLYAAVTRATLDGRYPDGWIPEQKIRIEEAVEAYTLGSAFAEFQEKEKGSLEPGKLADMVILSEDIFEIPPERIRDVTVEKTIVGGRVVYSAKEGASPRGAPGALR